jgi:hypothetical protein
VTRGGRLKQTWKWTAVEEAAKSCKTWSEVKGLAKMKVLYRCPMFLMERKDIRLRKEHYGKSRD